MKRIMLLAAIVSLVGVFPASASARHLPWKTIDHLMTTKAQRDANGLAATYDTRGYVWWKVDRVIQRPRFGQYRTHLYGYVFGTTCHYVCGLETKFYFTCLSWANFSYAGPASHRIRTKAISGPCYSFWIENVTACGGGPCIIGFTPGDTRPPPAVPSTQYEWTRSWRYWPTIFDPPI